MTSIDSARVTTCVVVAALMGGAATVFPSPGRADDGSVAAVPSALDAATATPALDASGVSAADMPAGLPEEVAEALDAVGLDEEAPADDSTTQAPPPEVAEPEAAGSSAPVPDAVEEREESETPDTMPVAADTTSDTASPGPTASTAPPAVSVQASPTNVNVSVRVESPGDNGPVTQLNVAAAVSTAAAPSATLSTAPSTAPATNAASSPKAAQSGGGGQESGAVSPSAVTPVSQATGDADLWNWEWDCVSAPLFSGISPSGSGGGSMPRNWTWIWNCGENPGQYQGATTGQYQPVNVNVSIRVGSPGNDGPVSQSNVAVAVSAGLGGARSTSSGNGASTGSAPASSLPVGFPGASALPGFVSLPAVLSPVVSVTSMGEAGGLSGLVVEPALAWTEGSVELPTASPILGGEEPARLDPSPGFVPRLGVAPRIAWQQPGLSRPALGTHGLDAPVLRPAPSVAGAAAREVTPAAKRAKAAPRWRTKGPASPVPETAPSGTSAAPSSGGGSSSGGLPIFLALPFLAALLDLARRVAIDRIATPSGHRSRIPDTPG
jgi:hypothetical protein